MRERSRCDKQSIYLFFLHVCLCFIFSFPFFVKHCNINLICECYSCTSTELEIHYKTKLLHGVIPMSGLLIECKKYWEIMRNFQEVTLCGRKVYYVPNYAISLEKLSHRTCIVIRFTTTLKISNDVSNAK